MLPEETKRWLAEFDYPEYTNSIRANQDTTRDCLTKLGFGLDSEIADFYLNYGALSASDWYELLEPTELLEMNDFAESDLELPPTFLPLTSQEGGGLSLVDRSNDYYYDIVFGELDDLKEGRVDPVARTFSEYLEWRRAQNDDG